jgi:hypothetical protein
LGCCRGFAGINHFENEISAFEFVLGALNADAFDLVGAFSKACGVDESQGYAMDLNDFLDGIAGGSCCGADNGTLESKEAIEQAAFADVRLTDDDSSGAVAENAALFGGIQQAPGVFDELIEA